MKKHLLTLITALALPLAAQATVHVAVVDSGTDFTHAWLKDRAWINTKEIAGNMVDDDRNGKVDDVYGWNFADNYNQVFVREHLNSVNPETFHIFEIIARIQAGTAKIGRAHV